MATTIHLTKETRNRLAHLKANPRETYEEVVNRLLSLVPEGDDEGLYTQAFRVGLLDAMIEAREGRLAEHSQVKRRLGL